MLFIILTIITIFHALNLRVFNANNCLQILLWEYQQPAVKGPMRSSSRLLIFSSTILKTLADASKFSFFLRMFYPHFNPNILDILTYHRIIININITSVFKWLSKIMELKLPKHLGNDGDYFVIITSSSHPLLLTEHAANGLVEAALK